MAEPAPAASARASAARAAALLAVLLALTASVGERMSGRGSPPAEPAACRVLPAVGNLPVPGGTAVQLIVAPALAGRSAVKALLYELAWRRPDLRFSTPDTWPPTQPVVYTLTLGDVAPPSGARRVWHTGAAAIWAAERW